MLMSYWVGPPGRSLGVFPVGDELAVGVEDRVGPEAGRQDVGLGLGDLEELGAEVEVLADEPVDRLVERQAVRRPLVGRRRDGEGPVEGGRAIGSGSVPAIGCCIRVGTMARPAWRPTSGFLGVSRLPDVLPGGSRSTPGYPPTRLLPNPVIDPAGKSPSPVNVGSSSTIVGTWAFAEPEIRMQVQATSPEAPGRCLVSCPHVLRTLGRSLRVAGFLRVVAVRREAGTKALHPSSLYRSPSLGEGD